MSPRSIQRFCARDSRAGTQTLKGAKNRRKCDENRYWALFGLFLFKSEEDITLVVCSLSFLSLFWGGGGEWQGRPPKKQGHFIFILAEPLLFLAKKGKPFKKTRKSSREKKNKEFPNKQGKGGQGRGLVSSQAMGNPDLSSSSLLETLQPG